MPTVLIYWSPGRSSQQKADVIHEITETLVERGGAKREDVLIIFQDIQPGDAGRAGQVLGNAPTATVKNSQAKSSTDT
jgi:phenylpyruvate tautomerase PptA (4-oxalocrotonate tautomerase family)